MRWIKQPGYAYGVRRSSCVAHRQKSLDTMSQSAWQRLATSTRHIKVRYGRYKCTMRHSHFTPARNAETCSVRTCSSLSQTFCPPIEKWPNSPDLNPVDYAILGALYQTVYRHQNFSSSVIDEIKRGRWSKHDRNYTATARRSRSSTCCGLVVIGYLLCCN